MISAILRFFGAQNVSKFIGAIVGSAFGALVAWGLPAELATTEIQMAVIVLLSGVVTWVFPANRA